MVPPLCRRLGSSATSFGVKCSPFFGASRHFTAPGNVVLGDVAGNYRSLKEANVEEFGKMMSVFSKVVTPTAQAERALETVRRLRGVNVGNHIDMHEHSLQTATRAHRDGADEETVVCALLHDVGEMITPINHGEVAAALLRPYISPKNWWILQHHEVFQAYYYQDAAQLTVKNSRERFVHSPHYDACVTFCEQWDQTAFDPDYESLPLEFFEPMVHRIFARTPYWHPDHCKDEVTAAKMEIAGGYPTAARV